MKCLIILLGLMVIFYAGFTIHQQDILIESQQDRIKHLELKVYEHERDSDYAEIIEQLDPLFQDELSLLNRMIQSEKERAYREGK